MTQHEAKELLPIITAFAEGKIVQYLNKESFWISTGEPCWNINFQWRIKPEPREYSLVIMRNLSNPIVYDGIISVRDLTTYQKTGDLVEVIHVREVLV